jgi:hypothetical protein
MLTVVFYLSRMTFFVIIDARNVGYSLEDAQAVLNRDAGTFLDKTLPAQIKILTNDGDLLK